jgi:carbonic anhydrase
VGELTSFVLRSPSEHTLNGEYMDAEIQYFYEDDLGNMGALAVLYDFEKGGDVESSLITKITSSTSRISSVKFSTYNDFLTADTNEYLVYRGSFTSPLNDGFNTGDACGQDVYWAVMANVQPISSDQQT